MKSRASVTAAESSSDPRQPNRFEKKKNIIFRENSPAKIAAGLGVGDATLSRCYGQPLWVKPRAPFRQMSFRVEV
jgi:hypothetical protein